MQAKHILSRERIEDILAALPNSRIGLIGDLFLDRYLDLDAARNEPSIETGLTAYQVEQVRLYPGALGTVLNNLAALGVGSIHPITVLGDDGEGFALRQLLDRMPAVDCCDIVVSLERRTPTYTKPMLREANKIRELNRFDLKNRVPTPETIKLVVRERLMRAWPTFDAVIVLDQVTEANCGVVTDSIRDAIIELSRSMPNVFVLADSRERIDLFRGVAVKPNLDECQRALKSSLEPSASALSELVQGTVFLTRGEAGIDVFDWRTKTSTLIPAFPITGPIDICGAGDSCSAGVVSAMLNGATVQEAAAFGNLVASITVRQIGVTGTATPTQVRERWRQLNAEK